MYSMSLGTNPVNFLPPISFVLATRNISSGFLKACQRGLPNRAICSRFEESAIGLESSVALSFWGLHTQSLLNIKPKCHKGGTALRIPGSGLHQVREWMAHWSNRRLSPPPVSLCPAGEGFPHLTPRRE